MYDELTYDFEHTAFPSLPQAKPHTLYLNGFSKSYAMTGWRVGYALAPAEIIAAMTKIHQYTIMCAPTMAQVAAMTARAIRLSLPATPLNCVLADFIVFSRRGGTEHGDSAVLRCLCCCLSYFICQGPRALAGR